MTEQAASREPAARTIAPLRGIRVVELGHIASAPFASLLLAELGADVVKVEPPDGDGMRAWPPIVEREGERFSLNFASVNRNKRAVRADLKDSTQRDDVLGLCRRATVVIENYRAGTLEKLGLGFEEVARDHPGLIYCSITGFGLESPYRDKGAFDVVVQAMSGLMSVTGEPGRAPVKCGVPVGDFVAALYAALTITALIPEVVANGGTIRVDCPMLDCLLGVSPLQLSELWGSGRPPERHGSAHPRNAPYQVFETADHPIAIAAGTERLWEHTCAELGVTGLLDDPRFSTQLQRARHQRELAVEMQAALRRRPRAEWLRRLDARGVPCGPVNDFAEIASDAHVTEGGRLGQMDVPNVGLWPTFLYPVRVGGRGPVAAGSPPGLGESDIGQLLVEWGAPR